MSALRRVSTAMSAQCGALPSLRAATTWSAIQLTSSGQVVKVAARTTPGGVSVGATRKPIPSGAGPAPPPWLTDNAEAASVRSGRLSTLATSRIVCPLRRLTVSANRAAGLPLAVRNCSANDVMLLAAAPRQP
jgi:hypothetical protein